MRFSRNCGRTAMAFTLPPVSIGFALCALLLTAAYYDVRWRRIPNWLTAGGVLCGVALNAVIGPPAGGLKFALLGFAAGFGFYFFLYVLHAMGAGDVKLMAAVGALVGWQNWLAIVVLTALLGGVAAIAVAVARKRVWSTFFNIKYILGETMHGRAAYAGREEVDVKSKKSLGLPHGAVIAAATVVFLSVGAYYGYGR